MSKLFKISALLLIIAMLLSCFVACSDTSGEDGSAAPSDSETERETVEVPSFEETGLHVTRLHYFASQPWGLSGSLLLGFFAETSDEEITLADGELAEAVWLKPEELPPPPDAAGPLSLTATMIKAFAEQSVHF